MLPLAGIDRVQFNQGQIQRRVTKIVPSYKLFKRSINLILAYFALNTITNQKHFVFRE